jgi:hypothetical protein
VPEHFLLSNIRDISSLRVTNEATNRVYSSWLLVQVVVECVSVRQQASFSLLLPVDEYENKQASANKIEQTKLRFV